MLVSKTDLTIMKCLNCLLQNNDETVPNNYKSFEYLETFITNMVD